MAVPRIPILVYHHVYVNDAPELQQAGFETRSWRKNNIGS